MGLEGLPSLLYFNGVGGCLVAGGFYSYCYSVGVRGGSIFWLR
jgi:hypothetical protein